MTCPFSTPPTRPSCAPASKLVHAVCRTKLFIDGEYIGDCDGTHKLDAQGLLDAKLGLKERSTA